MEVLQEQEQEQELKQKQKRLVLSPSSFVSAVAFSIASVALRVLQVVVAAPVVVVALPVVKIHFAFCPFCSFSCSSFWKRMSWIR